MLDNIEPAPGEPVARLPVPDGLAKFTQMSPRWRGRSEKLLESCERLPQNRLDAMNTIPEQSELADFRACETKGIGPAALDSCAESAENIFEAADRGRAGARPILTPRLDQFGQLSTAIGPLGQIEMTEALKAVIDERQGDSCSRLPIVHFSDKGGQRILDRIDYTALRKDPKIITGFSDLTAFHLAAARKPRVVTFHSPMAIGELWNDKKPHAFAAASFRRAVFAASYPDGAVGYEIEMPEGQPAPVKLVGGKGRGRLVGGNLTLICSTLGTPYQIEAKGNLLFLEDTNEAPYRIDRYLSQLRLAGVLDSVNGVILGDFTTKNVDDAKDIDRVLREYFGTAKVPVLTKFPVGHQSHNATLPHGANAELDADKGTLRLLENPVRLD